MKKTKFICLAFVLISLAGFSQVPEKGKSKSSNVETIFTPLKPADATPVTFNSKEELEAKRPQKVQAIQDLIRQNKDNPKLVKHYREELWRFENAIVKSNQ